MTSITQGENFVFSIGLNDVTFIGDPLTSGTLMIGALYRIVAFVAGDDFTNVGAAQNATLIEFTATGTTPNVWTNNSTLQQISKVPIAATAIDGCEIVAHQDRQILATWDQTSPQMKITDGLVLLEVLKTLTENWLGTVEFKVSPSFVEPDYFSSGAQTDVACFPDLIEVDPC